jgi:hypothetical protein
MRRVGREESKVTRLDWLACAFGLALLMAVSL